MRPENMNNAILQPEEHVLSTLEKDGSRRWLKPKLSRGQLLQRRRWVAYALIAIFTLLPFVRIGGRPFILLDIATRRFTIGGFTFLPTDTVLLAIFVVGILLAVFLFTALFGRVWCGWACPQTVYMEFLFRPIERFFDGTAGRGGKSKNVPAWRTVAKYAVYLVASIFLANVFLAYFIGVERLSQWVQQSPVEHPVPFLVMAFVTAAMMFDFCFFREQLCLVACPYGRFQSVLLDQNSLLVAYDQRRGEPRGKLNRQGANLPLYRPFEVTEDLNNKRQHTRGDCIDCGNCVTTCPTGIDIRDGLQMECINCTQCIDACNQVMKKIGRPEHLIRFSSQARDQGGTGGLLRARTLIYPILLAGIVVAFTAVLVSSKTFDAVILREPGNPHTITDDGQIRNLLKLKLTNRSDAAMTLTASIRQPSNARLELRETAIELGSHETSTFHVSVVAPRPEFKLGRADAEINIANQQGEARTIGLKLIGPYD